MKKYLITYKLNGKEKTCYIDAISVTSAEDRFVDEIGDYEIVSTVISR